MYIEPWYLVLTLLLLETNGHPSCQDRPDSSKAVDDLKSQFVRLQAQIQDLKHKDGIMEKKIQFLLSKLSNTHGKLLICLFNILISHSHNVIMTIFMNKVGNCHCL